MTLFLQPWMLAGLPLVMIPVLIHLWNRRRYRTVPWGAMMFLRQATRQSRRQSRLRHWLILAMRMLAIAAIVVILSRPLATGRLLGWGSLPDTVVIVLDRSASMEMRHLQTGRSKRSVALQRFVHVLETTGMPRQLVLIDSATGQPRVLDAPGQLLEVPESLGTDGGASMPQLLRTAVDYLASTAAGSADIWIASDLQATSWEPDASAWAALRTDVDSDTAGVRFQVLAFRQSATDNLAVRVAQVRHEQDANAGRLVLDIDVRGPAEPSARDVPLTLVIDGARSVVDVPLVAGRGALAGHAVALAGGVSRGWGWAELPVDTNPRDNRFYFTYGPPPARRAVVVAETPDVARVIGLAIDPRGDMDESFSSGDATVRRVAPEMFSSVDLRPVGLVVWQAPPPQGNVAVQLQQFIAAGGVCLMLPPGESGDKSFAGVGFGTWRQQPSETPARIAQWRHDSGLLRDTSDGQSLPLAEIELYGWCPIEGDAQSMAALDIDALDIDALDTEMESDTIDNNADLLKRVPTAAGGLYFLATWPAAPQSNLARQGIVWYALMQRAWEEGCARLESSRIVEAGPESGGEGAEIWQRLSDAPAAEMSADDAWVAGVYQCDDRRVARNRPVAEDTAHTLGADQLQSLLAGCDYHLVDDTIQSDTPWVREVWRLFVAVLLIALLAEAILALPDVHSHPTSSPRPQALVG